MSTAWALFWALFGFAMFVTYVSVATVLTVVVRRRAMEITCRANDKSRSHSLYGDPHLYCASLTSHWFGPLMAGIFWPLAIAPLLILSRLHRDDVSQARIERMERELGMKS